LNLPYNPKANPVFFQAIHPFFRQVGWLDIEYWLDIDNDMRGKNNKKLTPRKLKKITRLEVKKTKNLHSKKLVSHYH
jgi:hypothetical protein